MVSRKKFTKNLKELSYCRRFTRRDRQLQTTAKMRGSDNRLVIPWPSWPRLNVYQEGLHHPFFLKCTLRGEPIAFIVEQTHPNWVHTCTIDDILVILQRLPPTDIEGLKTFVLRQSTHKQRILCPRWGYLEYSSFLDKFNGPAVFIEAQERSPRIIKWGDRSLYPESKRELKRLNQDGHIIEYTKRNILVHSNPASARSTQLYRTLLHEIGHWIDYRQEVLRPSQGLSRKATLKLKRRYAARSHLQREDFAHRYADTMRRQLLQSGVIPFPRQLSLSQLRDRRLRPQDFVL